MPIEYLVESDHLARLAAQPVEVLAETAAEAWVAEQELETGAAEALFVEVLVEQLKASEQYSDMLPSPGDSADTFAH